jgi:hypothetical protein
VITAASLVLPTAQEIAVGIASGANVPRRPPLLIDNPVAVASDTEDAERHPTIRDIAREVLEDVTS